MAVAVLSPWPTTPAATAAALACMRAGGASHDDDDRLAAIGAAAAATVEGYAPSAPQALKNEAVIRFAGYLSQGTGGFGRIASETIGPLSLTAVTNHADTFRRSGAAMLLSRYRRRRGGIVG